MSSQSFYWFDYETFGIDPARDKPAQFAGVRTDLNLNPIGKELVVYNKLTDDYLPDPMAALVTGISPKLIAQHGLIERNFIAKIVRELGRAGTCNVGYNNIRFDDEFTRHTLFRNFHDPYEHEWKNGNSRWDLLDVVRLTRALRPDGINWPQHPDGSPSNRLEDLTKANGISHAHAHDALADVYATIEVARLIKQYQPKLFNYVFHHRDKTTLAKALNLREKQAVIHVSGMIPGKFGHTAIVMPLAQHPINKNGVIVLDLNEDPSALASLSPAEISLRIFTPADALPADTQRLAIKTIHLNKSPVVVPLTTLDHAAEKRLNLDKAQALAHREQVLNYSDLPTRITQALQSISTRDIDDVDTSLYGGGFFSSADKRRFETIRSSDANLLGELDDTFDDDRVEEMLFRYRARNFPTSLQAHEQSRWLEHCATSLLTPDAQGKSRRDRVLQQLNSTEWPTDQQALRADLLDYVTTVISKCETISNAPVE